MKILDIKDGGHFLTKEDVAFWQNATKEAIAMLGTGALGGDMVILSGVTFIDNGGGNYDYSAGVVFFQGELFAVDAGSFVHNGNNQWEVVETHDPEGDVQYDDLTTQQTYLIRKLKINNASIGSDNALTTPRYKETVDVPVNTTHWTATDLSNSMIVLPVSKNLDLVYIDAHLRVDNDSTNKVCTLPVQLRPSMRQVQRVVYGVTHGGNETLDECYFIVEDNGDVYIDGAPNYTGDMIIVYTAAISYFV